MDRKKFDQRELITTDKEYPFVPFYRMRKSGITMKNPIYPRPIDIRDNWKLFFEGKTPYWIPVWGNEKTIFSPRCVPDNVINRFVQDGGPDMEYDAVTAVWHSDWFDMDWVWVEEVFGMTVKPGEPKIPDITHWEDYVQMPDLDAIDWDQVAVQNKAFLSADKLNQLDFQCGLWERLMALMDVAEACIALVDEDLQPGVHRFFDAYSDFIIDFIGRLTKVCHLDSILIHDDWAHQNGPFFSLETAREMLVPYTKKIVDYCHSLGLIYEIHSCGACELLVPAFIETGADIWGGQTSLNDMAKYAQDYKDSGFAFPVPTPDVAEDAPEVEVRAAAKAWVEKYKDTRVVVNPRKDNGITHPDMLNYIYEYSRRAYESAPAEEALECRCAHN